MNRHHCKTFCCNLIAIAWLTSLAPILTAQPIAQTATPILIAATPTDTHSLSRDDITAYIDLLRIQNILNPSKPPLDDEAIIDLLKELDALSNHYSGIGNTTLKVWADAFYDALIALDTSYAVKFPELYSAWAYGNWINHWVYDLLECFYTQAAAYKAFWHGATPDDPRSLSSDCSFDYFEAWGGPQQPKKWKEAIHKVLTETWKDDPPPSLVYIPSGQTEAQKTFNFEMELLSTNNWTDAKKLETTAVSLRTSQESSLATLQAKHALEKEDIPYLLYLLSALRTGSKDQQSKVTKIVTANSTSRVQPNVKLIDQLVYYSLLLWADPLDTHVWSHEQMQELLSELAGVVVGEDTGSSTIQASLTKYGKILKAVTNYPMTDPYAPSIDFNTRKSQTLGAINITWKSLYAKE